jgi:hypothetical protein
MLRLLKSVLDQSPRAQTSFHFRGVTLHPPPHRDVIGVQAALGKEFLDVTVRQ